MVKHLFVASVLRAHEFVGGVSTLSRVLRSMYIHLFPAVPLGGSGKNRDWLNEYFSYVLSSMLPYIDCSQQVKFRPT